MPLPSLGASSQLGGFVRVPPFFYSLNANAMNERILSDDEIEALRKHWATAPTIDEAAKRLGVCRDTARYWARKLGLARPSNNPWTPELTERLVALTKAGYSGSVIAAELGVTRNSVIGKISRLGMQLGNCRNGMRQFLQSELRKPNRPSPNKRRKFQVKSKPVFEKSPIPPPNIEDIPRKTFAELSENDCRFPVNDPRLPGFGFCALPRIPGSAYCSGHHARCWQSVPVRKTVSPIPVRETAKVRA